MLPISSSFDMRMRDYVVEWPYVSNQPLEQPDGNPLLYLGLMLCAKRQFFPLDSMDKMLVQANYEDAKDPNGALDRSRFKPDQPEAYDDYIGLTHASHFTDKSIAFSLYCRGASRNWSYNNTGARGINSWRYAFWLYPGVVAHLKLAAGVGLSRYDRLSWCISLLHLSRPSESGLQKEWLQVDLYRNQKHRYWLCDKVSSMWENRLYRDSRYPNLMGSVFEKYFGPGHLLAEWMRGLIFRR